MVSKAKSKTTAVATESGKPSADSDPGVANSLACPLCSSSDTRPFYRNEQRDFHRCGHCDLIFVPKNFHLSTEDEKAIYDFHQNDPQDAGYRKFLSRLTIPLTEQLPPKAKGLDFGSGPGPTLSLILNEQGFPTCNYDIFYAKQDELLNREYDFITSTEVVEHLSRPREVLNRLFKMLHPKGVLGLMTKRTPHEASDFGKWHYIKDPTHITFYSDKTFRFIAKIYECELILPAPDVAILKLN